MPRQTELWLFLSFLVLASQTYAILASIRSAQNSIFVHGRNTLAKYIPAIISYEILTQPLFKLAQPGDVM